MLNVGAGGNARVRRMSTGNGPSEPCGWCVVAQGALWAVGLATLWLLVSVPEVSRVAAGVLG